jgi:putative ABC transport system permease protein
MRLIPQLPYLSSVGATTALARLALIGLGLILLIVVGRVPLRYNFRNLLVRWRTSIMTALAFTLVTALLVVMLAFVNGMYRLTQTSGRPGNVMILSEGTTDESFSNLGFSDLGEIEYQPGVLRDRNRPLASRETYLVVNQPLPNPEPGQPQRRFLQIRGLDDPATAGRVHSLSLQPGGAWFSPSGVQELPAPANATQNSPPLAIQCVLGAGIARQMARDQHATDARGNPRDQLQPGDRFELGDLPWIVTGVIESSGSTFDSEVWAKWSIVGPMFGKEVYSTLVLAAADAGRAAALKDFFNTQYKKAALAAYVETEYFTSLSQTNQQFLYAIIFVTIVMSIGGVFGVMNTMFAAVSQRTADLGVMRLLGFARWQILVSLLVESLAIAIVGGAAGCAIGSIADGWTATSVVSSGQGGGKFVVLKLLVDADTLARCMLVAVAMGFFGGLIPALSAMRLKPLESLR